MLPFPSKQKKIEEGTPCLRAAFKGRPFKCQRPDRPTHCRVRKDPSNADDLNYQHTRVFTTFCER